MSDVPDFIKLLEDFERIPNVTENRPTLMEIAGFPHYENTISNILAYYFDTTKDHCFKDLLLKSLMECITKNEQLVMPFETLEVNREVCTDIQNRIDIIIQTQNEVVLVENKIFASLYNDLKDYSKHLDKCFPNERKLKIILSIKPQYNIPNEYVNVTYFNFFESIRRNIGEYIIKADSKSAIFLMDFMATIQNIDKFNYMNKEIIEFFTKNRDAIERLFEENKKIKDLVLNRVHQLKSLLPEPASNVRQWIYNKCDLVHDFTIDNMLVAVDCFLDIDGILIHIWIRKGIGDQLKFINSLAIFKDKPVERLAPFQRIVIVKKEELPFSTPIDEVAEKLKDILKQIFLL